MQEMQRDKTKTKIPLQKPHEPGWEHQKTETKKRKHSPPRPSLSTPLQEGWMRIAVELVVLEWMVLKGMQALSFQKALAKKTKNVNTY